MKNSLKLLLSSALLLTLAACQGQDVATLNLEGGDNIVGGSKVSSWSDLSKHVLSILTGPGERIQICTAVLIRDNIALTAAHCVYQKNKIRIAYGVDLYEQGNEIPVDKVVIHELYGGPGSGRNDLALIRIAGNLPRKYKPVALPSVADTPYQGQELITVGYGRTGWMKGAENDGRLRQVAVNVDSTDMNKIWIGRSNGKGICQGDSGGPTFLKKNGEYYPIGIASYILMMSDDPAKKCLEGGVLMNVVSYLPWIHQNLPSLN
ncbi:MAG: trypsin-like serine protease [Bdellovibrio sp.]|nr:trypsin-like serine protease [Bdellovibrio sp.]